MTIEINKQIAFIIVVVLYCVEPVKFCILLIYENITNNGVTMMNFEILRGYKVEFLSILPNFTWNMK